MFDVVQWLSGDAANRAAQNLLHSPYWITVHEGVVALEEQYWP